MKTITIKGKFADSINNLIVLDLFRSNALSKPYDFRKTYYSDFTEIVKDLHDDCIYNIDLTGFTTGKFTVKISGEFLPPNPIYNQVDNSEFSLGYTIQTNS